MVRSCQYPILIHDAQQNLELTLDLLSSSRLFRCLLRCGSGLSYPDVIYFRAILDLYVIPMMAVWMLWLNTVQEVFLIPIMLVSHLAYVERRASASIYECLCNSALQLRH